LPLILLSLSTSSLLSKPPLCSFFAIKSYLC
jgi:hypothetical protein